MSKGYSHSFQNSMARHPLNKCRDKSTSVDNVSSGDLSNNTTTTRNTSLRALRALTTAATTSTTSTGIATNIGIVAPPTPVAPPQQDKWVINLSSNPLSSVQVFTTGWGPNFTIIPKKTLRKHMWQQFRKCAPKPFRVDHLCRSTDPQVGTSQSPTIKRRK